MIRVRRFPLEILVELIATHDSQTLEGGPSDRIEKRVKSSLALARRAGLSDLTVLLDKQDLGWLCEMRQVERFGAPVARLRIDQVPVRRASVLHESHIAGTFQDGVIGAFPIIHEPTLTPGFSTYTASDEEKKRLLAQFVAEGYTNELQQFQPALTARLN